MFSQYFYFYQQSPQSKRRKSKKIGNNYITFNVYILKIADSRLWRNCNKNQRSLVHPHRRTCQSVPLLYLQAKRSVSRLQFHRNPIQFHLQKKKKLTQHPIWLFFTLTRSIQSQHTKIFQLLLGVLLLFKFFNLCVSRMLNLQFLSDPSLCLW